MPNRLVDRPCVVCNTIIAVTPEQAGNILGVYCESCAKKISKALSEVEFKPADDFLEVMSGYYEGDGQDYLN